MAKDTAKIKFTAETGEFNDQIKSAESSLKELRSELKLNSSQMKNTGDNTKTLQERQKILAKELEASRSKTEALSQKVEKAKEIYGENSDAVKKYQTQLNNAKAAEEKIQSEIEDTNEQLKKQKTAFDEVADKAEKAGEKLTNAGKKMSKISVGIGAVGVASVAAFNAVDEGADNAIKATGATGQVAEALEQSYKNVASSIVGDFGDIGSAIGEVNTRFGFAGKVLETATTDFIKFSEVTGMDVTTAVQKVSRYMGDAGIDSSEYADVLDNLTVAAQASGVSMDTLTENLTKYGAPMRALGFDTQESIAIFSSWEKAGVNTEIAFSGMKKAISTWAKEGKDSRVEFKKTLDEIAACPDIASATTKAIEVFGTKAGPDLADAIKGGRFEYEEMLTLIEGSEGALENTFEGTVDGGYEMELAMQNAKVALAEVGATLSSSLVPILKSATNGLKKFASWWSGLSDKTQKTILVIAGVVAAIGPLLIVFGKVASGISAISKAMKLLSPAIKVVKTAMSGLNLTFLTSPIFWIIAAIMALVAVFVVLWKKCDWFRNFWKDLWEVIKNACSKAWEWIKKACSKAWEGIKNIWGKAKQWFANVWNGIKNVFSNVGSWFKNTFNTAKQGVQNAWSGMKNGAKNAWSGIKSVFSNVGSWFGNTFSKAWQKVKNVFSTGGKIFNGIKEGIVSSFKKVVNAIITGINKVVSVPFKGLNKVLDKIEGIKIAGIKPFDWLNWRATVPNIPLLAKGGIVNRATLNIAGEAGPEAIIPIDKLQNYMSNAVERSMQSSNIQALASAIEDLADRPIIFKMNDREFARATAGANDSVNGLRSSFRNRGLVID